MSASMARYTKKELVEILDKKFNDDDFVGYIFAASKGYGEEVHQVLVFFDNVVRL